MGYIIVKTDGVLVHHGVKGMKWGVRRYRNPDGTIRDPKGRKYHNKDGSLNTYGEIKKAYYTYKASKYDMKHSPAYKEAQLREKINQRSKLKRKLNKDYDKAFGHLNQKLRTNFNRSSVFWNGYANNHAREISRVADKMKQGKSFNRAKFEVIGSSLAKRTAAVSAAHIAPYAAAAGAIAYKAYKKRKKIPRLTQKKYFDPIDVAYRIVR